MSYAQLSPTPRLTHDTENGGPSKYSNEGQSRDCGATGGVSQFVSTLLDWVDEEVRSQDV